MIQNLWLVVHGLCFDLFKVSLSIRLNGNQNETENYFLPYISFEELQERRNQRAQLRFSRLLDDQLVNNRIETVTGNNQDLSPHFGNFQKVQGRGRTFAALPEGCHLSELLSFKYKGLQLSVHIGLSCGDGERPVTGHVRDGCALTDLTALLVHTRHHTSL